MLVYRIASPPCRPAAPQPAHASDAPNLRTTNSIAPAYSVTSVLYVLSVPFRPVRSLHQIYPLPRPTGPTCQIRLLTGSRLP